MIHYHHKDWHAFVNNQLPDPKRVELENHLYSCDECLELYLAVIDQPNSLPNLSHHSITDEIIAQLPSRKKIAKKRFYHHTAFHYGVAAAITLILMVTGVFHSISGYVQVIETKPALEQNETITQSLMDKAIALIDTIEPQIKEGK